MSISKYERQKQFHEGMAEWRRKLVRLKNGVECYKTIVQSWIDRVDLITGTMIAHNDSFSCHWSNSQYEYKEFFFDPDDLKDKSIPEYKEDKYISFENFAYIMMVSKKEPLMEFLKYWDAWRPIGSVLYAVNRYDDDAFHKEIKQELFQLIGEIANRRHELLGNYDDEMRAVEFKWRLFNEIVLVNGDQHIFHSLEERSIIESIKQMSASDVKKWLEAREFVEREEIKAMKREKK